LFVCLGLSSFSNPFSSSLGTSGAFSNPFSFGSSTAPTSTGSADGSAAAATEGEEDESVVGADSTTHYEPIVKLAVIETQSGEEEDEELWKERSILYRFDGESKEWKERGRGDVKFFQNKKSEKVRLIMRQEKTLKVCLNQLVLQEVQLKLNAGSDRSWTWRALDSAGDEPEVVTFAIRFKQSEIAQTFKAKYEEYQKVNKDKQ
jgi:Ran-binding protein 1